jgi:hypothetical protein
MTGRPLRIAPLALATLGLAGCPSISMMGTARTIPEGTYQYYAGASYGVLQDFAVDEDGNPESMNVPSAELGIRYGVTDRIEVGAKIYGAGAEANAKFQVTRSPSLDRGFDLAVAPALSIYPWSKGVFGWGHLAIPIGFNVGGGNQLVLAPRVAELLVTSAEGTGNVFWAGASMGFVVKTGRTSRLRVMPEVSAIIPVSKKLPTDVEAKFALEGPVFQGGIGFLFGP